MKLVSLTVALLCGFTLFAQPSKEKILKYKIKKALERRFDPGGDTAEMYWYYDRKGLDSVEMIFKEQHKYEYTWLRNGKINTKTLVKANGKKDVYSYTYQPDGSYKETMTDGDFGMKSYEWFDKKGNLIKSQSPDGNSTTFKYDAKGNQVSAVSDGKNNGTKINHKYSYNAKNQLIKSERNVDGNKSITTYQYDAKGNAIKVVSKGDWEGEKTESISTNEFNDKGLVVKTIMKSKNGSTEGEGATIKYEFEYEFH
jgi:YD repeat-containing protein